MSGSMLYTTITSLAVIVGCYVFWCWPNCYSAALCGLGVYLVARFMDEKVRATTHLQRVGKSVLITGCDTGFGHALAKQLASDGVVVFAGCLRATGDGATILKQNDLERLHVLQMDVTDAAQVQECVDYVIKITKNKGLWGLVNNAGLNFLGDVELTTMEQFERVTNINQLGMVRVTKALLPLIRQQRGRIVNITSVKGRLSLFANAAYGMTKFAGETFSDILRQEMSRFGVNVSIVEPGNFGGATGCLEMNRIRGDIDEMWRHLPVEGRDTYGQDYLQSHVSGAEQAIPTACTDLTLVTTAIADALFTVQPKARYLVGGSNCWYDSYKFKVYLAAVLPEWVMDNMELNVIKDFMVPQALRVRRCTNKQH